MSTPNASDPATWKGAAASRGGAWFTLLVLGALVVFVAPIAVIGGIAVWRQDSSVAAKVSTTADLTLSEFAITGTTTVPAGTVTLNIANVGTVEHNVGVPSLGLTSRNVGPGGTTQLALGDLAPGSYEVICEIPGHADSGMKTTLTVLGAGAPVPDTGTGHDDAPDYAALDVAMMESIMRFPAATEGRGNQMLEPTEVLSDGTKVFDLEASIIDWETEPGRIVQAWAYNHQVPGPQIWVDRGDKVQIRVVNNLPMGTDIHWHGVRTPNDQDGVAPITQDLIAPDGGTFTYEFVADEDAIGMYHAHNHAQMQVVNGMFGVFRIGNNPIPRGTTISGVYIPDDLQIVEDLPMILNDAGVIGFSLNGKGFPATDPLVVDQGDWVSVTYYNEGLQIHPMHLHQFPQLVYAKDGVPLEVPYWTDTLNIAPGERYTVLFRADDAGVWVWHCHILNHVERESGMFGMVTAIIVNEVPGFDPEENPVKPTNFLLTADHQAAQADHTHDAG